MVIYCNAKLFVVYLVYNDVNLNIAGARVSPLKNNKSQKKYIAILVLTLLVQTTCTPNIMT